jgi:hypothetical protein
MLWPRGNLLQRALIILDELLDPLGREFMRKIKVLPRLVQVQGSVRERLQLAGRPRSFPRS